MPRKEFEGQPMHQEGKLSEETRKEVFEKEGESVKAGEESAEGRSRHFSSPSESGSKPGPGNAARRVS